MWEVITAISATRIARVWHNGTGVAYRDNRKIDYGLVGSADITGILRWGQRLEIEIKTGNATQTPEQKSFEAMIKKMGGIYFVARSVESALEYIQILEREHNAATPSTHGRA